MNIPPPHDIDSLKRSLLEVERAIGDCDMELWLRNVAYIVGKRMVEQYDAEHKNG